jgi:hypothetical protein
MADGSGAPDRLWSLYAILNKAVPADDPDQRQTWLDQVTDLAADGQLGEITGRYARVPVLSRPYDFASEARLARHTGEREVIPALEFFDKEICEIEGECWLVEIEARPLDGWRGLTVRASQAASLLEFLPVDPDPPPAKPQNKVDELPKEEEEPPKRRTTKDDALKDFKDFVAKFIEEHKVEPSIAECEQWGKSKGLGRTRIRKLRSDTAPEGGRTPGVKPGKV